MYSISLGEPIPENGGCPEFPESSGKDFTASQLESKGLSKEMLSDMAKGYADIAKTSPVENLSASSRAAQLSDILGLFK